MCCCFLSEKFFTEGRTSLPQEAIVPKGPIAFASQGRSVPVFLRQPIATFDFPGDWGPDPLPPPPS